MTSWQDKEVEAIKSGIEIFQKVFDQKQVYITQNKCIVSCQKCNGTGFVSHEELTDYHRREYTTFTNSCDNCKGSGRRVEISSRISFSANYRFSDAVTEFKEYVPYPDDPIDSPDVNVLATRLNIQLEIPEWATDKQ